jgi:hypothetical protein
MPPPAMLANEDVARRRLGTLAAGRSKKANALVHLLEKQAPRSGARYPRILYRVCESNVLRCTTSVLSLPL